MEYDKEKHIVFRIAGPTAGVANRMHGYCHAKIFSDLIGKRLCIYDNHRGFRDKTYKYLDGIFDINFTFSKQRPNISIPKPWDSDCKIQVLDRLNANLTEVDYCNAFLNNFFDFKFVPEIISYADTFIKEHSFFPNDAIGVAIRTERGGAKRKYFTENDITMCVSQIVKYLDETDVNSIFLTGGKLYGVVSGIEQELLSLGINVLIDKISSYERDDIHWLRDMEILSRCSLVVGHVESTYATSAARIKKKDFMDMKSGVKISPPHKMK